jgi:hypothetical protein
MLKDDERLAGLPQIREEVPVGQIFIYGNLLKRDAFIEKRQDSRTVPVRRWNYNSGPRIHAELV